MSEVRDFKNGGTELTKTTEVRHRWARLPRARVGSGPLRFLRWLRSSVFEIRCLRNRPSAPTSASANLHRIDQQGLHGRHRLVDFRTPVLRCTAHRTTPNPMTN